MIKNYLEKIQSNVYEQDLICNGSSIKEIEQCEKRLGLSLPIPLKELYEVFGKDKKILNTCNSFLSLKDLQIIDGLIVFNELIDKSRKYGALIEDSNKEDPKVKLQQENNASWYFEARNLSEYILNNIFWHGVNLMKFSAKIKIKEENLERNLQDILYKISDERKFSRGTKYSYYDKEEKVMAAYLHYEQILILGANDKSKLQEVECNIKVRLGDIKNKLAKDSISNQTKSNVKNRMKLLKKALDSIDQVISNSEKADRNEVNTEISLIESKLNIKLPEALREFYLRYNKTKYMLNAFYIFKSFHELAIEDGILQIGYSNEQTEKYGIYVNDLSNEVINVKVKESNNISDWSIYEELTKYIINSVVFQAINVLEASVVLEDSEIVLEEYFTPLYYGEEKDIKRISYISNDGHILALHFIDENIIYFGAVEDKILNEFEEKIGDINWLIHAGEDSDKYTVVLSFTEAWGDWNDKMIEV
ncbi:SMI1/KNR4 family protein [Clostridium sp. P21]|uniref:SMI1/KNR4 family protein n=1 Tax=Clostridium muellerianum TaxID=2716538 RepID=A0A7Y0EFC8_9CLOT|nr:SMI1/KNR4 family protein [Clostridium muellerianum]NMM62435.1 SMI1/KNR4 family protein [Clostridium muellerianum]